MLSLVTQAKLSWMGFGLSKNVGAPIDQPNESDLVPARTRYLSKEEEENPKAKLTSNDEDGR